tara:strand:- start:32 stop:514 length:483 start_codon:yes stop_codon:yes gene_type:complete
MFDRVFNCFSSPPEPELTQEERDRLEEDNTLAMTDHFDHPGEYRKIEQIKKDSIEKGRRLNNGKIPPFVTCSRLKKYHPELNAEKYNSYTGGTFVDGIHLYPYNKPHQDIDKCYVYVYKKPQGGGKNSISRIKKNKSKRKNAKRKSHKRKNKSKRTRKRR